MTNSSKKPATASRDNLDLDLEARLDQATSTMPLDDEPSTGDALDQILARAKKGIDTDSPETLTPVEIPELRTVDDFDLDTLPIENDEIVELKNSDDFRPIKSDTMTSMEKQLTATMNASINSPQEDEELDRLLGDSGFDLDSLLDSLLGEAASDEIVTDIPEINEDSIMATVDELLNFDVMEENEEVAVKPEPKTKKTRAKAKITSEIAVDEIVESEPNLIAELEPEIIAEALDEIIEPEENELGSDDELTVEPEAALDDLVDAVPFEDTLKVDFEDDTEIESFSEEFNNFDEVADSVAPLVEISTSDESLDDFNEMQLDELNEIMENDNDTITAGFDLLDDDNLEKDSSISVTEPEPEDDWMKQLEGLDEESAVEEPAPEEKMVVEDVEEDDDWMKQLEGLDEEFAVEEPATVEEDDDWMKQLEGLDEESTQEEVADDDDWMKQLEGMEDHDEDTAKMLMDIGHDDNVRNVVEDSFNIANEMDEKPDTRVIDEEAIMTKASDLAITQFKTEQDQALSQLRADQNTIDSKNKKQFTDAENKRKKAATFSYIALGVGVIGLLGSAGIGWFSYGAKDKTEILTQSVTALEEKVDVFLAKNPEKEIENLKTSVEQLNQKVEKLVVAQVAIAPPVAQPIVENGKVSASDVAKTHAPIALPNNKVMPTSPKVTTDSTVTPAVSIAPENLASEKEMAKKTAEAEKAEAQLLSQKIAKANAVAKAASVVKPSPTTEKTNYYTGRTTRGMAHAGTEERSKTTKPKAIEPSNVTAPPSKEILNTIIVPKKAVSAGKYAVNVISYQQEWFAQSKAAEFKQKGIPVEVVPVDANDHATKYRLAVSGFKNKAEANAYAEKIKKQHNLNETWVGSN